MSVNRPKLRCRICGGPAFDCECWKVEAYRAEADRCTARLSQSTTAAERHAFVGQRDAAFRLRNEAEGRAVDLFGGEL